MVVLSWWTRGFDHAQQGGLLAFSGQFELVKGNLAMPEVIEAKKGLGVPAGVYRVTRDIEDAFLGVDGIIYPACKTGDVVTLPVENANVLVERGIVAPVVEPKPATITRRSAPPVPTSEPAEPEPRERRDWRIVVNDETLQNQTTMALDALADVNDPPFLFQRARSLVRVEHDENEMPLIRTQTEAAIRGILERCASFVTRRGIAHPEEVPVPPPLDVVRDLMSLPEWNTIPPLAGIIECPTILADNTLVTTPGYNTRTRLYYKPAPGLKLLSIAEHPTKDEVSNAVKKIEEVFTDFPFVDDASRTMAYAALFSVVVRPMIPGAVPLMLIDKPQAGTGASLVAEGIAIIGTGRQAAMTTAPKDEAEWKKTITTTLRQGRTVAIVDNVEQKLFAPSLAAVITSSTWTDRLLGVSENITLPHRLVWLVTGNNVQLGGDLPRRCCWVRMDAKHARPWQREGFRHPNLLDWLQTERGHILAAILTIARAWILAGKPRPQTSVPKMGGFDGWRDTIGGILHFAGVPDFLGNVEEMYAQADADTSQWESFFEKWHEIWGDRGVTVAELARTMQESNDSTQKTFGDNSLLDVLPDDLADAWSGKKNFSRVMGKALARMNGRVFTNGLTLVKGAIEHQAVTWKVKRVAYYSGVSSDVKGELQK